MKKNVDGSHHAVVRSSDGSGRNWGTIDDWQLDSTKSSFADSIFVSPSIGLFDGGYVVSSATARTQWFTRQLVWPLTASISTPVSGSSTLVFNHSVSGLDLSDLRA